MRELAREIQYKEKVLEEFMDSDPGSAAEVEGFELAANLANRQDLAAPAGLWWKADAIRLIQDNLKSLRNQCHYVEVEHDEGWLEA